MFRSVGHTDERRRRRYLVGGWAQQSAQTWTGRNGIRSQAGQFTVYFLFGEIIMNSRIIDIAKYCLGAQVRGSRGEKSFVCMTASCFRELLIHNLHNTTYNG